MLKFFFLLISTIALLCTGMHWVHYDPGTLSIAIDTFELQTTLWFALACLILLCFCVLMLDRFIRLLRHLGDRSHAQWLLALDHILVSGQWPRAIKLLNRLAHKKHHRHLQALAHLLEAVLQPSQPNDHSHLPPLSQGLVALLTGHPQAACAIWQNTALPIPSLLRSTLWLITLKHDTQAQHQAYWQCYQGIQKDLKKLYKQRPEDLIWLCGQLLQEPTSDIHHLWQLWHNLPKALCQNPAIASAMATQLIEQGCLRDAQQLLQPQWQKHWRLDTLEAYLNTFNQDADCQTWLLDQQKIAPASIQPHLYAHLGLQRLREGDHQSAYQQLKQAINHPNAPQPLPMLWQSQLALCLLHLGKTHEAEHHLETLNRQLS